MPEDATPPLSPRQQKHTKIQEQDKRLSVELSEAVKVCVWKADLTTFEVDAIVNAANENLHHSGGLALALSAAGGPGIIRESDLYIRKYGTLKPGEAVVTTAGKLPCKKLIHAVGPRIKPNPSPKLLSKAKKTLKKTVESILHEVTKHNFQSVAIPSISSGIFNFPLPMCANIIVSTVKEYYDMKKLKNQHLIVHLVNHDEQSTKEMERACMEILSPTSKAGLTVSKPKDGGQQVGVIFTTDSSIITFKMYIKQITSVSVR